MVNIILLDAGPLGLVTHPKGGEDARICKEKRAGISVQIATTNIGHLSRYAHVIEIPSP
jgi:hypothetical protein